MVAVGRPGERLPQVGAQRVYLTDDAWQARIIELMEGAALVVLRTGSSAGFHWEVGRALSTLSPEKLLVIVDNRKELRGLLEVIANHLGQPSAKVSCRGKNIGSVKGLVMFEDGWVPRPLRLRRGTLRDLGEWGNLSTRFVLSLQPLFERHGIRATIPPISRLKIVGVAFLLVWAALAAFVWD
ncbi:hypothetical protein [Rhizobium sp. BK251]|uniref:hypothetical protein n=1 Tax=Rhizobium sp. BK251 TaxID=2512125 RepID=UPI0010480A27|nr:hypothetical protein [Rhizobium sp. BK251]TCL72607.1 hypothetical protein EV286_10429 [Rhizobium sp. BK251]